MSTLVVSDLDGVLVDTRSVVADAYRAVGVDVPEESWGHPWRDWLVDLVGDETKTASLHSAKTNAYRQLIRKNGVPQLPAAAVLRELDPDDVLVVTSSARSTAGLILDQIGIGADRIGGAYLTLEHRVRIIGYWSRIRPIGIYLDDVNELGRAVVLGLDSWTFCHVTSDTTEDEVRSWTQ